jgi:membrane-bound lytic murein transglycosylase B
MHRPRRLLTIGTLLLALTLGAGAQQPPPTAPPPIIEPARFDLTRPDIRAYIEQAVSQGVDRAQLMSLLTAAEPQQKIIDAISKPAEKTLQWWEYRARMLTPLRIEAGAQLWREHKELLDQIALEYQVPPEYLIAVLGVETQYGRITGRYRVLDALATLGFDYTPRTTYFQGELTQYLLLAHEEGFDPLSIRGSYAGAMGALQFMPSSYRKFAVSGHHLAHRDLWGDWGDIFASTANYGGLRAHALTIPSTLPDDTPAILLAAPLQEGMSYRVGFQNFYVITRYNSSPLYAMAVHDLAQALKQQVTREAAM